MTKRLSLAAALILAAAGCTQETQNQFGRSLQNWTGVDGVLEVYGGDKLVRRFIKVDKLTTAAGTESGGSRPYRFGYGVLDLNLNGQVDPGERRVYFEVSDYSTNYVFFGDPGDMGAGQAGGAGGAGTAAKGGAR